MGNYSDRFPVLEQYLGGLFHQDWSHVFDWKGEKPNYRGVVRYFKVNNKNSADRPETAELKKFLALNLSDPEFEDILKSEFSLGIRPAYWNLTHKEWLEDILRILEEPLEKTKKEFIPEFAG